MIWNFRHLLDLRLAAMVGALLLMTASIQAQESDLDSSGADENEHLEFDGSEDSADPSQRAIGADREGRSEPRYGYLGFLIGGEFASFNYSQRDPRVQMGIETGHRFFALLGTVSFGQNVIIIGLKPRLQLMLNPIPEIDRLYFGPGVGGVFNVWLLSATNTSKSNIELGGYASGHIRYQLTDHFHIAITPILLELNFWRDKNQEEFFGGNLVSNGDLGIVYSASAGLGYTF